MINSIKNVLKKERNVAFAYLYGSFLKNPEYANDIDIAIFLKKKASANYERKLALKIEKEIKKPVDVISLNEKPLLVISEVLTNGKLIFSKDDKLRINFETRMMPDILNFNELMKEFDKKRLERYGIKIR